MAERPLTSEVAAWNEFQELHADPLYRGEGVVRGDGRAVLVLPGLFGNDLYLQPLRSWLRRIGYQPVMSTIPLNVGCPDRIQSRVERSIGRHLAGHHGEVAIIGHSRGGMLGKALASRIGARCSCFVALGSPVGAVLRAGRDGMRELTHAGGSSAEPLAAPSVVAAGRWATRLLSPQCRFPDCDCSYLNALFAPLPETTRTYAIYSTEDPVVPPHASNLTGAVNIEVTGTHSGLVANRAVYRHLAGVLAGNV